MSYHRWDGSDDEDDAVLLFQSPVRSKSMKVLLSAVSPPQEENEEEEEPSSLSTATAPATCAKVNSSSAAAGVFRSPSNVVQFNPQSIYTGTYIQEVLQSLSSSSLEDMENDGSHAVSPSNASLLQRISSLPSSEDCIDSDAEEVMSVNALGGCYIFMDTEDEDDGDRDVYNDRAKDSFLTPAVRPQNWKDLRDIRTEVPSDRQDSIPRIEKEDRHPVLSPMKQAFRSMLGGFHSKKSKRYTASPSPLDDVDRTQKHRISDLAVQAIADSCGASPLHSAAITRNALVDFAFWEQAILKKQHSSFFLDAGTAETSSSSLADDEIHDVVDDDPSGVIVKAVSLMVQDSRSAITSPCPPSSKASSRPQQPYDSILDEFDEMVRPSAEEIAQSLNIEEEGRFVLSLVRGRTGMVEDLADPPLSQAATEDRIRMIPWIHIVDDLWIPHYEEYVIRAVHAFSHQLLSFHTKKKKQPPILSM